MPTWIRGIFEALPFVAWAICGLLALLLQPSNPAARRLAAVGTLFATSRLLDYLLGDHPIASVELSSSWLARWLDDTFFLAGTSALVATLAVFPHGRYERRFERGASIVFPAVAVIASLCRLFGSPLMTYGGEPGTAVPNEAFVSGLRALGPLGDFLMATEPAWIPVGVVMLVLRFRRSRRAERAELMWPLAAIGAFALTLVVIVAGRWLLARAGVTVEDHVVSGIFLLVLSLFPVSLILSVAARARRIQAELALSRERIVRAESDVRRRIERDLHDGVQQQLVGLLSLLEVASREVERGETRIRVVHSAARRGPNPPGHSGPARCSQRHPSPRADR